MVSINRRRSSSSALTCAGGIMPPASVAILCCTNRRREIIATADGELIEFVAGYQELLRPVRRPNALAGERNVIDPDREPLAARRLVISPAEREILEHGGNF